MNSRRTRAGSPSRRAFSPRDNRNYARRVAKKSFTSSSQINLVTPTTAQPPPNTKFVMEAPFADAASFSRMFRSSLEPSSEVIKIFTLDERVWLSGYFSATAAIKGVFVWEHLVEAFNEHFFTKELKNEIKLKCRRYQDYFEREYGKVEVSGRGGGVVLSEVVATEVDSDWLSGSEVEYVEMGSIEVDGVLPGESDIHRQESPLAASPQMQTDGELMQDIDGLVNITLPTDLSDLNLDESSDGRLEVEGYQSDVPNIPEGKITGDVSGEKSTSAAETFLSGAAMLEDKAGLVEGVGPVGLNTGGPSYKELEPEEENQRSDGRWIGSTSENNLRPDGNDLDIEMVEEIFVVGGSPQSREEQEVDVNDIVDTNDNQNTDEEHAEEETSANRMPEWPERRRRQSSQRKHYGADEVKWVNEYRLDHWPMAKRQDWIPAVALFNAKFNQNRTVQALFSLSERTKPKSRSAKVADRRRSGRLQSARILRSSPNASNAVRGKRAGSTKTYGTRASLGGNLHQNSGTGSAFSTSRDKIWEVTIDNNRARGEIDGAEDSDDESDLDEEDVYEPDVGDQDADGGDFGQQTPKQTKRPSGPNKHYTADQIKWLQEWTVKNASSRKLRDWFSAVPIFNSTFQENRSAQALFSCALRNTSPGNQDVSIQKHGGLLSTRESSGHVITGTPTESTIQELREDNNDRGNDGNGGGRVSIPALRKRRGPLPGSKSKSYRPEQVRWLHDYRRCNPSMVIPGGWIKAAAAFNAKFNENRSPEALYTRVMRRRRSETDPSSHEESPGYSTRCKRWTSNETSWLTQNIPRFIVNGRPPNWSEVAEGLERDLGIARSAPSIQNRWWRMMKARKFVGQSMA